MPQQPRRPNAHAQIHAQTRTRERRERLAHEAARLMAEAGIRDYQLAKRKAAQRLGIHDDASLPRNTEIDQALRSWQRLFRGDDQAQALAMRRQAALDALEFFAPFAPRLAGPVLDGSADADSPVDLQLHTDAPAQVAEFLEQQGIPAQARQRRMRLDRERNADVDVWLFVADGIAFDVAVLPHAALRQAPLAPLDGKPMARASLAQLRKLLEDGGAG